MHSFPNKGCSRIKVKNIPDSYPKTEKHFTDTSQHFSPNNKLKTANNFKASFMGFVKQCK